MSRLSALGLLAAAVSCSSGPSAPHFPGENWEEVSDPEAMGWMPEKLDDAIAYSNTLNTASAVIVHQGRIVRKWGEPERKFKCHSVRKSFLSALYGIHVENGNIDLSATLEELGIDDNEPSLTPEEKQATVGMLLKARSGVYHPALYETKAMAARRPERYSHPPDTYWYYNNWDFNTLGTIFEQETGSTVFGEFKRLIADPVGMQRFDPETDCEYYEGEASDHPAYLFEMNALDMARFGLLFARNGKWRDQQVIPESWVKESTTAYSDAGSKGGYGYLWWVAVDGKHFSGIDDAPEGLFTARGKGGQVIAVMPGLDLVVVHRVNTYKSNNSVSYADFGQLLLKILDAYEKP